jgi:hypothetical protein
MWKCVSFGKPLLVSTYVTIAITFFLFIHYVVLKASFLKEWEFCFVVVHYAYFCGFSFVFYDFGWFGRMQLWFENCLDFLEKIQVVCFPHFLLLLLLLLLWHVDVGIESDKIISLSDSPCIYFGFLPSTYLILCEKIKNRAF